ncbi:tyrosine-protein phosphatase [Maricaulis sp. CAU 1757]
MKRVTPLEGVHNFRHFHDYPAADGRRVRAGLYRSGQFSRASEADREHLAGLGLRVVADLRKRRERDNEPSAWSDALKLKVIASDLGDEGEPPHLQFLRKGVSRAEEVEAYMLSAYQRIPMEACNQEVFRGAYRALASGEADGGFLVHCAAGKDRTGIFCALVLSELGVARGDVVEDYLLTNHAVDFDAIVPRIQERSEARYGVTMPDELMRVFLGVDARYLDAAFEAMGDLNRYVVDTLGIRPDERAALRARWLDGW